MVINNCHNDYNDDHSDDKGYGDNSYDNVSRADNNVGNGNDDADDCHNCYSFSLQLRM